MQALIRIFPFSLSQKSKDFSLGIWGYCWFFCRRVSFLDNTCFWNFWLMAATVHRYWTCSICRALTLSSRQISRGDPYHEMVKSSKKSPWGIFIYSGNILSQGALLYFLNVHCIFKKKKKKKTGTICFLHNNYWILFCCNSLGCVQTCILCNIGILKLDYQF